MRRDEGGCFGKKAKSEVDELINSFVTAANGEEGGSNLLADELEHEAFWMDLPASDSRSSHIQSIPSHATRNYPGMMVKPRADALGTTRVSRKDFVASAG